MLDELQISHTRLPLACLGLEGGSQADGILKRRDGTPNPLQLGKVKEKMIAEALARHPARLTSQVVLPRKLTPFS
ncbi:MAG: hypothetical protein HRT77_05545 [Halioglobus sp.]|nr:hypothetical protein [Halioglobus sp.]